MPEIFQKLGDFGVLGLFVALALYLVAKGEFVFRYPRRRDKGEE